MTLHGSGANSIRRIRIGARVAALTGSTVRYAILAVLLCANLSGDAADLFAVPAPPGNQRSDLDARPDHQPVGEDEFAVRSRNVQIDFSRLDSVRAALLGSGPPSGGSGHGRDSEVNLVLNLFDDTVFKAIIERTDPTSAGYSLAGGIDGIEFGQVVFVVNGDIVFGSVSTPMATYWIRSYPGPVYRISEVDYSKLPPPDEPTAAPEDESE